jgi:hypothetical protein
MLICDLCSRLVATSTHRSLDSRARRLRDFDRRFARRPTTRALTRAESGELVADAGVLLPAPPAPGGAAIVRRGGSLRQRSSSPEGCVALFVRPTTRGVLVRQRPSRMNVPLTPCVTLPSRHAEARRLENAEDPSSRDAPTPRGCEPRAPSIDRSADSTTSKLAASPTAATAPAAWPRRRSFRPGFHAHAVRARSRPSEPLFAARPSRGPMPSVDFCNRDDP